MERALVIAKFWLKGFNLSSTVIHSRVTLIT